MYIEETMANKPAQDTAICQNGRGSLPACAELAFPYVPMQKTNAQRYANREALQQGTLYPGLDLPFKGIGKTNMLDSSDLNELMAIDFAVDDIGLYLTTHADDKETLKLYWSYIRMAQKAREAYESQNGPLWQTEITEGGYRWLDTPWPWDEGGNN